jgi:hypothetical protein
LPPDLFKRYGQLAFWRHIKDSKAFRIVAQRTAEKQRGPCQSRRSRSRQKPPDDVSGRGPRAGEGRRSRLRLP